jgi:hypothetical protein
MAGKYMSDEKSADAMMDPSAQSFQRLLEQSKTTPEEKLIEQWKRSPDEASQHIFNSLKAIQFEDGVVISKVRYIWNKGGNKTVGFELKGREYPSYGLDVFITVDKRQLEQRAEMPIQKDIEAIKNATGITGGRKRRRKTRKTRKSIRRH